MSGKRWTDEEDGLLRELVAAGKEYRLIARRVYHSTESCRYRACKLGIRLPVEAILANRAKGRQRFYNNPKKVARRLERISKRFTPEERAILAQELAERNRAGITGLKGKHHRPEVRQRIAAAHRGRKMTAEHRAKIAEGRRRYWERWRANKPEALLRAAMLKDSARQAEFAQRSSVELPYYATQDLLPAADLFWCAQCERRVDGEQASVCASRWCKAKQAAA
jgi:hypothetical protein